MDTVMKFLPAITSLLGGVLSAGPWGAIFMGVAAIGLLIGGVIIYNKIKQYQFKKAQDDSHQNQVDGQNQTIKDNQDIAIGDSSTVDQHKSDKQKALDELNGGA